MKIIVTVLLIGLALANEEERKEKLKTLAEELYKVEDKVDHLLFHFSHDVTKHEYQATPFGTFLAPVPKNPNSIHQKLKLIDYLNHQMGHPGAWHTAANNAYNMGMGAPATPGMGMNMNPGMGMNAGMGMNPGMGMNAGMGMNPGIGMGAQGMPVM